MKHKKERAHKKFKKQCNSAAVNPGDVSETLEMCDKLLSSDGEQSDNEENQSDEDSEETGQNFPYSSTERVQQKATAIEKSNNSMNSQTSDSTVSPVSSSSISSASQQELAPLAYADVHSTGNYSTTINSSYKYATNAVSDFSQEGYPQINQNSANAYGGGYYQSGYAGYNLPGQTPSYEPYYNGGGYFDSRAYATQEGGSEMKARSYGWTRSVVANGQQVNCYDNSSVQFGGVSSQVNRGDVNAHL